MTAERAGYGVLSDESFERSRQRIGIPLRISPAHITEVTADATRHFAYGYGDDNPLWCDEDYPSAPVWAGTPPAPGRSPPGSVPSHAGGRCPGHSWAGA